MNDELICSGVWSVGDQEKVMRSDTFLSVYQQKPLRNNQAGSHGGGDFDLYGDGSELDNNLDENEKDFPDRDDSNKTTKMVIPRKSTFLRYFLLTVHFFVFQPFFFVFLVQLS